MSASVLSRHEAFSSVLVAISEMQRVGLPPSVIDRSLTHLVGATMRSMVKGEAARATSPTKPPNMTGDPRLN